VEYFALKRTVEPATEPIVLDTVGLVPGVKEWCRIDANDGGQDATLNALIKTARRRCEDVARRALVTQTWQMSIDRFPGLVAVSPDYPGWEYLRLGADGDPRVIRTPRPPLISVSSISYVDTAGATQTADPSTYLVDTASLLGRVFPAYGSYWPVTRPQGGAVTMTYVAGYGAAAAVPDDIVTALKIAVAYLFENREQVDGAYLDSLFQPFQVGGYYG
jgi:hypothetical protein